MSVKASLKSSWTPLSQESKNNQIFEERKKLVFKWFDKWTEDQRKIFLSELFSKCKPHQLSFATTVLEQKAPTFHKDFTSVLPKVISQYIFSFLDPRSLCRAIQVCSHWKFLAESDQIWLPKCIRLGWFLNGQASEYDYGTWKRLYVENIQALQVQRPNREILAAAEAEAEKRRAAAAAARKEAAAERRRRPPAWRGPDPRPKDIARHNYLDNDDEIERSRKLKQKGQSTHTTTTRTGRTTTLKSSLGFTQLRRSNSASRLQSHSYRSQPVASGRSPTSEVAPPLAAPTNERRAAGDHPVQDWLKRGTSAGQQYAGVPRPAPVAKLVVRRRSPERTNRDLPSVDLFPQNPWTASAENAFDSD